MPVEGRGERDEPWPLMPYYFLGNLDNQHKVKSFSRKEIEDILFFRSSRFLITSIQKWCTEILSPENILLESRNPSSISIRIADFGLAKVTEGTNLKTDCGTNYYMAPEIYGGQKYKDSVDLWSAGLIVVKYIYIWSSRKVDLEDLVPGYCQLC